MNNNLSNHALTDAQNKSWGKDERIAATLFLYTEYALRNILYNNYDLYESIDESFKNLEPEIADIMILFSFIDIINETIESDAEIKTEQLESAFYLIYGIISKKVLNIVNNHNQLIKKYNIKYFDSFYDNFYDNFINKKENNDQENIADNYQKFNSEDDRKAWFKQNKDIIKNNHKKSFNNDLSRLAIMSAKCGVFANRIFTLKNKNYHSFIKYSFTEVLKNTEPIFPAIIPEKENIFSKIIKPYIKIKRSDSYFDNELTVSFTTNHPEYNIHESLSCTKKLLSLYNIDNIYSSNHPSKDLDAESLASIVGNKPLQIERNDFKNRIIGLILWDKVSEKLVTKYKEYDNKIDNILKEVYSKYDIISHDTNSKKEIKQRLDILDRKLMSKYNKEFKISNRAKSYEEFCKTDIKNKMKFSKNIEHDALNNVLNEMSKNNDYNYKDEWDNLEEYYELTKRSICACKILTSETMCHVKKYDIHSKI